MKSLTSLDNARASSVTFNPPLPDGVTCTIDPETGVVTILNAAYTGTAVFEYGPKKAASKKQAQWKTERKGYRPGSK